MKTLRRMLPVLMLTVSALVAAPAQASFHLMQVEQVIGGVDGDVTAQAIQLRMRSAGQDLVAQGILKVRDAAGLNPITILDMTTDVPNGLSGDRVLIVSAAFQDYLNPMLTQDFIMTNLIPPSYLAAGSLTFEADAGTIYWRLSWGGAGYTGAGNMSALNDNTANSNPPFAGALPSTSLQALLFSGAATLGSTSGSVDYAPTAGASSWTNNARQSATVEIVVGVGDPPPRAGLDRIELSPSYPNPTRGPAVVQFTLASAGHVTLDVYDAAGALVRHMVDADMSSGLHDVHWDGHRYDGSPVPGGIYFYRLEALGQTKTTRVVQLR